MYMKSYSIVGLCAVFALLIVGSNLFAWVEPRSSPPQDNVAAPLNTGAAGQVKSGNLVVNTLGTTGNIQMTHDSPRVRFDDLAGGRTMWLFGNDNRLYLRADRDNADGDSEGIDAFSIFAGVDSANDYAEFANQVRAVEYCNRAGENCFRAGDVGTTITRVTEIEQNITNITNGGGSIRATNVVRVPNDARAMGISAGPARQISSRTLSSSALDDTRSGFVTFYTADQDTANYLCKEQYNRDYGIWTQIAQPSYSGWAPYDNLTIRGFAGQHCTSGDNCYAAGMRHGRELYCYNLPIENLPVRDIVPANKY
jgi:hypothetical protein